MDDAKTACQRDFGAARIAAMESAGREGYLIADLRQLVPDFWGTI
jgi:hypothetical protein